MILIASDSGQQLRQDDPSALKDIVDIVHTKITEKDKSTIRYLQVFFFRFYWLMKCSVRALNSWWKL